MGSLLYELESDKIISAEIATNLRNYIVSRNPSLSPVFRANIFADAVKRIVNNRIPQFNEALAKNFKDILFKDILSKQIFSIDSSDVLKSAIKLKKVDSEFSGHLNEWLSAILKKDIAKESLIDFISNCHRLMDTRPDDNISDILDLAEFDMGGLRSVELENEPAFVNEGINEGIDEGIDEGAAECAAESICEASVTNKTVSVEYILSFIENLILPSKSKRILITSAFTVASLSVILFSGKIADAAQYHTNTDSSNAFAITQPSNSSTYDLTGNLLEKSEDTQIFSLSNTSSGEMRMRATAYDLSVKSCGKLPSHPEYGITSSGKRATVGRTVAVDPNVIPLGSKVFITFPQEYSDLDGIYMAEDTGRLIKGNSIDIFFGEDSGGRKEIYNSAMKFGIRYVDVRVLE